MRSERLHSSTHRNENQGGIQQLAQHSGRPFTVVLDRGTQDTCGWPKMKPDQRLKISKDLTG